MFIGLEGILPALLGIVAAFVIAFSPAFRGKWILFTFALLFGLTPVLNLIYYFALMTVLANSNFGAGFAYLVFGFQMLLSTVQGILLLTYCIRRRPTADNSLASQQNLSSEIARHGETFVPRVPRHQWRTNLSPAENNLVLRRREWAMLIEMAVVLLFITVLYSTASFLIWGMEAQRYGRSDMPFSEVFVIGMIYIAVIYLLFGLPCFLLFRDCFGNSLGKWITGCRPVDSESGLPINVGQAFGRNALLIIPGFWLVELAFAIFHSQKLRIGDLMASTKVVAGPANFVDGVEVQPAETQSTEEEIKPHPLD